MTTEEFLIANGFVVDVRDKLPRHDTRIWVRRELSEITGMVWHQSLASVSLTEIAWYHVGSNHISSKGLPGISYTFVIDRDGTVYLCNDLENVTYSQGTKALPGDENRSNVAVCFLGDFDGEGHAGKDRVTVQQLSSGLTLWLAIAYTLCWTGERLRGHYHFGKPACPGTSLSHLIELIRATD